MLPYRTAPHHTTPSHRTPPHTTPSHRTPHTTPPHPTAPHTTPPHPTPHHRILCHPTPAQPAWHCQRQFVWPAVLTTAYQRRMALSSPIGPCPSHPAQPTASHNSMAPVSPAKSSMALTSLPRIATAYQPSTTRSTLPA
eukprot:352288-Chlamydomonas_euryale.AAC.3